MRNRIQRLLLIAYLAGMFGLLAVCISRPANAQQSWSRIDCSASLVSATTMDTCFVQPVVHAAANNSCLFEQYVANTTSRDELSHLRAFMLDRQKSPTCGVTEDLNWATSAKRETSNISHFAQNWSPVLQVAGTSGMYFELHARKCFAFYKMGPRYNPVGLYHFTYVSLYSLHGYICGSAGSDELSDTQIARFINSIRVREP